MPGSAVGLRPGPAIRPVARVCGYFGDSLPMSQIRVGVSGWTYAPWRGDFYPKGLTQKKELEYASRKFTSIEINGTFYSLQRPTSFQSWYEQTPADFIFSVKGGQFITHVLRLKEVDEPVATFFASGILCL